jgi:hypothetical protein
MGKDWTPNKYIILSERKGLLQVRIKKENIKSITEAYHTVNGWSKTFRNPRNSFVWGLDKEYIQGEYEQIEEDKYIYSTGNVSYVVRTV